MISNKITRMLLIAGVALVSCNENALEQDRPMGNVDIIATIDNEGLTRSCIDSTTYDGKTGILWTDGDRIGVFTDGGSENAEFSKKTAGTVAKATFGGNFTGTPKYAYYPYSAANANTIADKLTGTVNPTQEYSLSDGLLTDDWKYGSLRTGTSASADGYEFKMTHLFALAKVVINATGTPIEGETLESISIKATSGTGSEIRRINGGFTFSAVDGRYELTGTAVDGVDNTTTMVWTDKPALTSEASYTGYITLIPNIAAGDKITITVKTNKHTVVFEVPCKTSLESGFIYDFPMTLTSLAEKMYDAYETIPTYTDNQGNVVTTGEFTACAFNVDGLPDISYLFGSTNPDGPGKDGTSAMAGIANNLGWDFIAASEDFEYHSQLTAGLSNYNAGTYRGTVSSEQLTKRADTDGMCFFWKKGLTVTSEGNSPGSSSWEKMVQYTDEEGGLTGGANTCIKKGFRHYEVEVAEGVIIDVYITHMNTYSGSGNTESNAYVKAVLGQLRQLRDYVLTNAKTNKRPAIIMGDTNMRYTRHDIKTNFLDVVAAYDNNAGYTVSDPWVEFHRGGIYPAWDSKSLMTRFAFAGDTDNDIVCSDNQRGEVVDKIWYINVPGAEVQLKATGHQNDVDNFTKSVTKNQTYSGVTMEDANGNITTGDIKYDKVVGYSDHFPVVTTFQWTKTVPAK